MPWYKSGTVSVTQNSNAVIGTGTSFIANSRVGDAFRGPDGGWYEVTNIASDTALSISPNYQGANNAAGTYALAPMQGYVKDSADALRALVNQFGGVLGVLGEVATIPGVRDSLNLTNTDGMPEGTTNKYYTDARGRAALLTGLVTTDSSAVVATDAIVTAFGKLQAQASAASASIGSLNTTKAAKGANSDITSLTGLTTALGVAFGGTGGNSQATARTGLGLGSAAIVDAVGLMANNAIIETGSSGAGSWTKFADGTMLTQHRGTIGLNITTAYGALFYGSSVAIAFPQTFVGDLPKLSLSVSNGPVGALWVGRSTAVTASGTGSFIILAPASLSNAVVTMDIIAVGRWKV